MQHQTVIVLDFGGQYNQLIARRVRECSVYCEVRPYTTPLEELRRMDPIGFIFTGGPGSVYAADAPLCDPAIFTLGVPVLGICYGCQFMAHTLGGRVTAAQAEEVLHDLMPIDKAAFPGQTFYEADGRAYGILVYDEAAGVRIAAKYFAYEPGAVYYLFFNAGSGHIAPWNDSADDAALRAAKTLLTLE